MKPALARDLLAAAQLSAEYLLKGVHAAVAIVDDQTFLGPCYWDDAESAEQFELEVAAHALRAGAETAALATSVFTRVGETQADFRPPVSERCDDEVNRIWLLAIDTDVGLDIGFCDIAKAVIAEPVIVTSPASLTPSTPGWTLVRTLAEVEL